MLQSLYTEKKHFYTLYPTNESISNCMLVIPYTKYNINAKNPFPLIILFHLPINRSTIMFIEPAASRLNYQAYIASNQWNLKVAVTAASNNKLVALT